MLVTGNQYTKVIPKPVLTRWEHVGTAVQHIKTHAIEWKTVVDVAIGTNSKSRDIDLVTTQPS